MTQPKFVPVLPDEKVRRSDQIDVPYPVPEGWEPDRPAEINAVTQPQGQRFGTAGPDQGYGLLLARRFEDKLKMGKDDHYTDVIAGCLGTALRRASSFGRAPVIYDFQFAYTLWGFLTDAPADLVAFRAPLFEACHEHYEDQRKITDSVIESTLRLTAQQVAEKLGEWKTLINAS